MTGDLTFVVLSAAWCGDCKNAMPVFLHLEETLNLNVRVFGKIKTAPLDPDRKWAIPPSPPEIEEWGATAIPWIEIFNSNGERVGTIIERPRVKPTLEAEILHLLKDK
ncbi:MAG: thioredoxin family protein [Promethearchaeota archaeon]